MIAENQWNEIKSTKNTKKMSIYIKILFEEYKVHFI